MEILETLAKPGLGGYAPSAAAQQGQHHHRIYSEREALQGYHYGALKRWTREDVHISPVTINDLFNNFTYLTRKAFAAGLEVAEFEGRPDVVLEYKSHKVHHAMITGMRVSLALRYGLTDIHFNDLTKESRDLPLTEDAMELFIEGMNADYDINSINPVYVLGIRVHLAKIRAENIEIPSRFSNEYLLATSKKMKEDLRYWLWGQPNHNRGTSYGDM